MKKKIIIAVMVVLVAAAAYYMYNKGKETGGESSDTTIQSGQWGTDRTDRSTVV